MNTDFAVPFERNREMIAIYRQTLEREFPGQYVIFGHIGDAHVHVNILPRLGRRSPERAKAADHRVARQAVRLGGTVSAEHGLGKRKANLLAMQYTVEEIEAMRSVNGYSTRTGCSDGEPCLTKFTTRGPIAHELFVSFERVVHDGTDGRAAAE